MTHIERITGALVLASWWVIRGRFDTLSKCVEISICGAKALEHYKIKARAVPCAFLAIDNEREITVACGHSARALYDMIPKEQRATIPLDAWLAQHRKIDIPDPVHAAIDATHCGHRIFVDLTVGQVRPLTSPPVMVPDYIRFNEAGWPSVRLDSGVGLLYCASPNEQAARRLIASAPVNNGIVDDFIEVMDGALACDLDPDKFKDQMIHSARRFGYLAEVLKNHASIMGVAIPPDVMTEAT